MSETIIKIDHVSKEYRLGAIGGGTLRGDLQAWWARIRGKDDPNLQIGKTAYTGNEKFLALDDISFEVKKGEAVGIIGHNGAGKSTLLKLLSRVTAPTKGTIGYNGRIASMLEVGTGFHPELTGRENVYMNGAILGMTKAEISRKFDQIVEFAEMEKFIDTPVKRYSSGMYVKLAFAVAAHLDSEILVMDEVLAVGDMKFQQKCLGKMGDAANNEGRTVLYVSHNMNTIRQLCSRCVVLDHGNVAFDGGVEEGIGVYMDAVKRPEIENDCSSLPRKDFYIDGNIFTRRITFLSVNEPVFYSDDTIKMCIDFVSQVSMSNLYVRLCLFYGSTTPVGMASTGSAIIASVGNNRTTLLFHPSNLAPGLYTVRVVFYSMNEYGTTQTHDVADVACSFEIKQQQEHAEIQWESKYWGFIKFPEIGIE